MPNIFIGRQAAESGEPCRTCPLDVATIIDEVGKDIIGNTQDLITYDEDIKKWMNDELAAGCYRQGWGLPGLDLRSGEREYCKQYLITGWKYHDVIPDYDKCCYAKGRWDILKVMLEFKKGDILFIPMTPDDNHFTVATVALGYRFSNHSSQTGWRKDFGHRIEIERRVVYEYSPTNLLRVDFKSYRRAVNPVRKPDRIRMYSDFLHRVGY